MKSKRASMPSSTSFSSLQISGFTFGSSPWTAPPFPLQQTPDLLDAAWPPNPESAAIAASGLPAAYELNCVTVDPSGKYLYVANSGSSDVSGFTADVKTGRLTSLPKSPFTCGSSPDPISADIGGKFVYVANKNSGSVSVFKINTNGSLSPLQAANIGTNPVALITTEDEVATVPGEETAPVRRRSQITGRCGLGANGFFCCSRLRQLLAETSWSSISARKSSDRASDRRKDYAAGRRTVVAACSGGCCSDAVSCIPRGLPHPVHAFQPGRAQ
jgi:Lactonase, 7-bladed beta-propeller